MMRIGTVTQLWRYPVKSMSGEPLDTASISARGIPGDRGWAVHDETRAGITNAKRVPALRRCHARYATEPAAGDASPRAVLTFPDGSTAMSDSEEAARRLSELSGRPLSLRALGPAGSEAPPRVSASGDSPETVRELMGILPGETEPDYSAFTPEGLARLRQGNFFDAFPIHLLTHTTLHTLKRLAPESDWDDRRFRANILVEAVEPTGYPELEWLGRRIRVGSVMLEVIMGCPRCVMVTRAGDGLPEDHRIMRTLVRETKHIAGIYLRVVEPGQVKRGDPVEAVE